MKAYKWGAELPEPTEIWSRYDENGNINKDTVEPLSKTPVNTDLKVETNK